MQENILFLLSIKIFYTYNGKLSLAHELETHASNILKQVEKLLRTELTGTVLEVERGTNGLGHILVTHIMS